MRAERLSKLAIAAWAVAVVVIEGYYASPGWAALRLLGPTLLVASAILSVLDRRTVAALAAAPYLFPAVLYLWIGAYHVHYTTAWLAAMLGFVLPDAVARGWHAPPRWAIPLACWAGVVAVTAPIVVLRSVDFHLELLTRARLPYEALGGVTFQSIGWIGHVALVLVIGILWFDWLLSLERRFFVRWVATPFAASALVPAGVAIYQMVGDISFLNPTLFASLERATGTLFDANITGAVAAYWIGGWIVLAASAHSRMRYLVAPALLVLWGGVWASSSRTAFASAVVISIAGIYGGVRSRVARTRVAPALIGAGIAGAMVVFLAVSLLPSTVVGPLQRFGAMGEMLSSPAALWRVVWNRDGYGIVADRMIASHPLFGVGVGSFHELTGELMPGLAADNAQNWYRHQLAELGIVGSLGWLAFVLAFLWSVVRARAEQPAAAWTLRSMLLVFAAISLVGMPGQDPAVAVTFWTMAAWCLHAIGTSELRGSGASIAQARVGSRWWIAMPVICAVSAVGTTVAARGSLRVPVRAQHATLDDFAEYSYGFYPAEPDGDGEFRWVGQEGTIVVPATGRVLTLTLSATHRDLGTRPLAVKAWVDGRLLIDRLITADDTVVNQQVVLPADERRVLIETWADRAVEAPAPDGRLVSMQVRWRFDSLRR
jgi:hypothetical protein